MVATGATDVRDEDVPKVATLVGAGAQMAVFTGAVTAVNGAGARVTVFTGAVAAAGGVGV